MKQRLSYAYLLIVSGCLLFCSCKKDSFITTGDARIATSVDSLKYDTVFTSIGSTTQSLKIINLNGQRLRLSKVKLMGGAASSYKININGYAASELSDIEVAADDSIYVFVTVNINPNLSNLPFIVTDSIEILYNGNTRYIKLEAFGQNANFLRNKVITGNVRWTNNLPYVILGSVRIDTTASLTVDAGCKIYAHADAPIIVDGTLIVNGSSQEEVIFSGDRTDADYKDLPAGWPGIYFRGNSKNNVLKFAVVKNAYQAIVAEKPAVNINPKVTLHQCKIDNAYDAGILCVNSSLNADNSLVSNCGNNVSFIYGGSYNLTNCTIAAYSTLITHKNPSLQLNNFITQNGSSFTANLNAVFSNCIFWGETGLVDDELSVVKQGPNNFVVTFNKCLYKAINDPANSIFTSCLKNQDPMFDSIEVSKKYFDFHTTNSQAPGINKGGFTLFSKDLDDKDRNIGLPDLGCYEKQ